MKKTISKAGGIPRRRQQKRQGPEFKGEPEFVEKEEPEYFKGEG